MTDIIKSAWDEAARINRFPGWSAAGSDEKPGWVLVSHDARSPIPQPNGFTLYPGGCSRFLAPGPGLAEQIRGCPFCMEAFPQ